MARSRTTAMAYTTQIRVVWMYPCVAMVEKDGSIEELDRRSIFRRGYA